MNEIMNTISQFISNVGFPIACCCIMLYQNKELEKTIDNNSQILAKLDSKIDTLISIRSDKKHE